MGLMALLCSGGEGGISRDCLLQADGYGEEGNTPLIVEPVASGLVLPWGIAFLSAEEFLVTERRHGRLRLVRNGRLVDAPVLTLDVDTEEVGGLMDVTMLQMR